MDRDYVQKENNRFIPTRLGTVVTDLLTANFPDIMDVGFTATMEEQLDDVAEGEREWEPMLKDFLPSLRPLHREGDEGGRASPSRASGRGDR